MPNDPLSLEKLRIHERLLVIEEYVKEGKDLRSQLNDTMSNINLRTKNMELMIHGDSMSTDKYSRDGINRRLESIEAKEKGVDKAKETLLKVAVGAITLAIGSCVLWVFRLIATNMNK